MLVIVSVFPEIHGPGRGRPNGNGIIERDIPAGVDAAAGDARVVVEAGDDQRPAGERVIGTRTGCCDAVGADVVVGSTVDRDRAAGAVERGGGFAVEPAAGGSGKIRYCSSLKDQVPLSWDQFGVVVSHVQLPVARSLVCRVEPPVVVGRASPGSTCPSYRPGRSRGCPSIRSQAGVSIVASSRFGPIFLQMKYPPSQAGIFGSVRGDILPADDRRRHADTPLG